MGASPSRVAPPGRALIQVFLVVIPKLLLTEGAAERQLYVRPASPGLSIGRGKASYSLSKWQETQFAKAHTKFSAISRS